MTDAELIAALGVLGIDEFCPQMMALWPFVEWAWNDNRVTELERSRVLKLVRSRRALGRSGVRTLHDWLGFHPSDKFLATGHKVANALIERHGNGGQPPDIVTACRCIADQTASLFGRSSPDVPPDALAEIARMLYVDPGSDWNDVGSQVNQTVVMKSPFAQMDLDESEFEIPKSLTAPVAVLSRPPDEYDAPAILVLQGPSGRRTYPVRRERLTIGRGPDNDIVLTTDVRVSRHHCTLERRGETYFIVDNDSANGTHVNGEFVVECPLDGGERISIGDSVFTFEVTGDAEQPRGAIPPT